MNCGSGSYRIIIIIMKDVIQLVHMFRVIVNHCHFGCGSTDQGTLQVHSDSCEKCSEATTAT